MKVELLQSSSKTISIRLSFPELTTLSYTLAGLGLLLLICAYFGLLTAPVANFLNLEPHNIKLATYLIGAITALRGIFVFLRSQTSTKITLDKSLNVVTLTHKSLIKSSIKTYPLSNVTGIEEVFRKNFIQIVLWLKMGDKYSDKYKGKAIEVERVNNGINIVSALRTSETITQAITEFLSLSQHPVFIFENDWIVENQGDVVKIFRYDAYTIRVELSIDKRQRLLIWSSEEGNGSCSLKEIEDIKLEDNPKDTNLSEDHDRIILIMKNGVSKAISPYYPKYSRGQHSPGLLKMIKKYIQELG